MNENSKMSYGKLITTILFILFSLYAFFTVLSTLNDTAIFLLTIANRGISIIRPTIMLVCIVLIIFNLTKYSMNQLFIFCILILFFILYQVLLGSYINYILILLTVFVIRDDTKIIYQAIIVGILIALISVLLFLNLGMIENQVGGIRSNGSVRYNMGFYGLMIFGRFWRIIAMCHTLSTSNIKKTHMIFIILGAVYAFFQTQTRSELFLVLIIYGGHFYIKKNGFKIVKILHLMGILFLMLIPLGSAFIGRYYHSFEVFKSLNQFTTGRFLYSANLWNNLQVKFLGNHDFSFFNGLERGDIGYYYNFVDNGWDQMLLIQGLGPTILLIVLIFLLLNKLKSKKEVFSLYLLVIMIVLFAISQSVMFSLISNPLIFKFGLFFKRLEKSSLK